MWVNPCIGTITSRFGPRSGGFHNGTDIGAPTGTPIWAASSGVVTMASYHSTGGNMTKVDHGGGIVTWYLHQSRFRVSVGQHVSAGQHIGDVGSTGNSTGPHLHFEVRVNGSAVNAEPFMKERGVTLGVGSPGSEEDDMTPLEMLTAQFEVSPGRWVNVAQALSAIYFYGDRNEFTAKKVWEHPLKHSISGDMVPAEAFLRFEPKEHQNSRDIIVSRVLAALADVPGVNADAVREAVEAGIDDQVALSTAETD